MQGLCMDGSKDTGKWNTPDDIRAFEVWGGAAPPAPHCADQDILA